MPTPPGSNKPAGLPEDTALMGNRPRIAPAHPSPGGTTMLANNHLTAGGVNILAPAELSKMFPTPPSHEYPMQSPCGQMEGLVDGVGDMNSNGGLQNGVKSEPGMNGCSPTYLQEDVNKVRIEFVLIYFQFLGSLIFFLSILGLVLRLPASDCLESVKFGKVRTATYVTQSNYGATFPTTSLPTFGTCFTSASSSAA